MRTELELSMCKLVVLKRLYTQFTYSIDVLNDPNPRMHTNAYIKDPSTHLTGANGREKAQSVKKVSVQSQTNSLKTRLNRAY